MVEAFCSFITQKKIIINEWPHFFILISEFTDRLDYIYVNDHENKNFKSINQEIQAVLELINWQITADD